MENYCLDLAVGESGTKFQPQMLYNGKSCVTVKKKPQKQNKITSAMCTLPYFPGHIVFIKFQINYFYMKLQFII